MVEGWRWEKASKNVFSFIWTENTDPFLLDHDSKGVGAGAKKSQQQKKRQDYFIFISLFIPLCGTWYVDLTHDAWVLTVSLEIHMCHAISANMA